MPVDFTHAIRRQHRTYGNAADPHIRGATIYGDKGPLKLSVMVYDFIPADLQSAIHKDVTYELEQSPDYRPRMTSNVMSLTRFVDTAQFAECIATREKPVADIEQGYIATASCIRENFGTKRPHSNGTRKKPNRQRARSQQIAPPRIPRTLGPSSGE